MDRLILLLSILVLAVGASHASWSAEVYWHSVLPNSPMPSAIRDLLHPDMAVDKKTGKSAGAGIGNPLYRYKEPAGTDEPLYKYKETDIAGKPSYAYKEPSGTHTPLYVYKEPAGTDKPLYRYKEAAGGTDKPLYRYKEPAAGTGKPLYAYKEPIAGTGKPLHAYEDPAISSNPALSLFFLEKDLHVGAKLTVHFTRTAPTSPLLPRRIANSIPFSSAKLPEILARFSVKPDSVRAKAMKETLELCEEPAAEGETKRCATSLESMVDFAAASLGTRNLRASSTTVAKEEGAPRQQYTVASVKKMAGTQLVFCHTMDYPSAVFYCHRDRKGAAAYTVSMVGVDGTAVEAVGLCHTETATWSPNYVGFQVRKVKPGAPVCHFLSESAMVWAPSK